MTRWDERFDGHPVFPKIDELRSSLDSAKETQKKHHPKEQEVIDGLERAEALLDWISQQLKAADPYMVPQNLLKSIHGQLNHANNEATTYTNDRNAGHIENLNNHLEGAIPACSQLPRPKSPEDITVLGEAASSYRRSVGQLAANLSKDFDKANQENEELRRKVGDLKEEVDKQKARLDQAISQFQEQASAAQESHRKEADQTIEELRGKFQEKEEKRAEEHAAALAAIKKEQECGLDTLEGLKSKAQKLVDAVGSAGMSAGYQKVANKLRGEAMLWQTGAVLALVGLVVTQILYVPQLAEGYDPWQTIVLRTVFVAGFILLAGYCAAQARRAHRLEEWNRKLELQLASLGPFVADLPEEEQQKLRREIAMNFFQGPRSEESAAEGAKK